MASLTPPRGPGYHRDMCACAAPARASSEIAFVYIVNVSCQKSEVAERFVGIKQEPVKDLSRAKAEEQCAAMMARLGQLTLFKNVDNVREV